jgi:rhomboid family GlyGly-CTERM serine protease
MQNSPTNAPTTIETTLCIAALAVFALLMQIASLRGTAVDNAGLVTIPALAWERAALDAGDWWRLFTGSWVHLTWAHLALNFGGAALVFVMFTRWVRPLDQTVALLLLGVLTSALLWWMFPRVQWMVGLSGALHGLFAWNAMTMTGMRDPNPDGAWWRGPRYGFVLLAGVVAKVVMENLRDTPAAYAEWLGGPVLIEAHQAGIVAGLMLWSVSRLFMRARCGC